MNPVALLLLLLFSSASLAATDTQIGKTFHQEVPNVQQTLEKSLNNLSHLPIKAEDYCKDATCKKDIAAPSLSHYLNDSTALTQDSQRQLATDPNASNITSGFNHRPKRPVNPNDPAYINAKHDMADAYEISHGKKGKYTDCTQHQRCTHTHDTRQCTQPVPNAAPSCLTYPVIDHYQDKEDTATATVNLQKNGSAWQFSLPPQAIRLLSVTFPTLGLSTFGRYRYHGHPTVHHVLNQHVLSTMKGSNWRCMIKGGHHSKGQDWNYYACSSVVPSTTLSLKSTARQYTLQLEGYRFTPSSHTVTIRYAYLRQVPVMKWVNDCSAVPPKCRIQAETCIEAGGTRNINGIPTTMRCWKKKRIYRCHYDNTCTAMPISQRLSSRLANTNETHCTPTGQQQCSLSVLGVCVQNTLTYSCKIKTCHKANITCGELSFCLDGDCYQGKEQKNTGFNQSASALAGLGSAAASLKQDPFQVFTGKPAFCSKKPLGISDCCADKGWGQGLGLTQCSEEEKGLAQAKQKGLTIDLGQFCAEKVLGVCIRKKKGYCQFDSKMARIVQQQGRPQLGINFGQAKSPQCQGLSPEQMQKLNFSTINFNEFYEDLHNNINLPDTNEVQHRIESKYKDLGEKQS